MSFVPLDLNTLINELGLGATEETFGNQQEKIIMTQEQLSRQLVILHPKVVLSLQSDTYLSPLHEKLATKSASLKHLDLLTLTILTPN